MDHLRTMSLRTAVAAPFVQAGSDQLPRSDFVVDLSLDRDWFSPEQAKRLIDIAEGEGLVTATDDSLELAFDPTSVTVPDGYQPDESILRERSTFERVLDTVVAEGTDKQQAVAAINGLQSDLGVTLETAAILYARRQGIDVDEAIDRTLEAL
ncbi:Putative HTH domain, N-terminal domain of RPA1 protein family [Halorhabdus sp. BNX81]|nr:Putative HTH domain, N-terminal domain of RPA1 protein family [Halorhabdus sp. BNX81]